MERSLVAEIPLEAEEQIVGEVLAAGEPLEASDVAFLAPELVSEVEGPIRVPERAERRLAYRIVKRTFDIVFSLGVIAVLLVPSVALCIAIRIESPGNPLYSQKRVGRIGRNGKLRTFNMYKFRSMHADADERLAELADLNEADGPLFKIKDDPRVTDIGKFIRKHSMASVIIGTPGDGESTKSLSRSANSSLDLQLCERRPEFCFADNIHYKPFEFLSAGGFRVTLRALKRTAFIRRSVFGECRMRIVSFVERWLPLSRSEVIV